MTQSTPASDVAPAAPTTFTPPALSAFDAASRTVLGGAGAAIVAALLGTVLGAWGFQPFALVVIVLGLIAAGAAYAGQAMDLTATVRARLPLVLQTAGALATSLGALAVIEMLADLDDLDDYGGPIGIIMAVVVFGGSIAMLVGALRGTTVDVRGTGIGARVAGLGAALVLGAWVLQLTIGFWSFGPAVWSIAAIVLATALLVFGATDGRLPAAVGWVTVALGLFTAWTALGQWSELMRIGETRLELGPDDILPFLIYLAGIVLVIAGGVLHATGGRLGMIRMALPTTGATASDEA